MKAQGKGQTGVSVTRRVESGVKQSTPCQQEAECSSKKRHHISQGPKCHVYRDQMAAFLRLIDDDVLIQYFLWKDSCCRMSDKYLLAMTFLYFKRASLMPSEHTRRNFFIALCLANTMEEEEWKNIYEILAWALGKNWRQEGSAFLKERDQLWARMEFRAAVSHRCCEEVMAVIPSHSVWKRQRAEHHCMTQRRYNKEEAWLPQGLTLTPLHCTLCVGRVPNSLEELSSSTSSFSSSPLTFTLSLDETRMPPWGSPDEHQTIDPWNGQSSDCEQDASPNGIDEDRNCSPASFAMTGTGLMKRPAPSLPLSPSTDRSPTPSTSVSSPGMEPLLPWAPPPPPDFRLHVPGLSALLPPLGFRAQLLPRPPPPPGFYTLLLLPGFRALLLPPPPPPPGF